MARKPHLRVPDGFTHVMLRGNVGVDIFFSKAEGRLNTEHRTRHAAIARHLKGLNNAITQARPRF
jgi:hypothetical protein